jgi:xanthine/uracil permease
VLGGTTTLLYGLIGILGARIWIQARVDFRDPVNLITAAVGLILGIADFTVTVGGLSFAGIAVGSFATIVIYHVLRAISRVTGTGVASLNLSGPVGGSPHDTADGSAEVPRQAPDQEPPGVSDERV